MTLFSISWNYFTVGVNVFINCIIIFAFKLMLIKSKLESADQNASSDKCALNEVESQSVFQNFLLNIYVIIVRLCILLRKTCVMLRYQKVPLTMSLLCASLFNAALVSLRLLNLTFLPFCDSRLTSIY